MQREDRVRAGLIGAVLVVLAATVRLGGITSPPQTYWDEQYYAFDASAYLGGGHFGPVVGDPPLVRIDHEGSWVHPPLGKWMIAAGIGPLGFRPLGWRLPSAVFGIAGVVLLYLLALELWGSVWWAGLAGLLLATDGLHIVQSRMAMLDVFLTTFVTAGILMLAKDRARMRRNWDGEARRGPIERLAGGPYRLGAGLCLGAAVATKWSGAFALLFGLVLCGIWAITADGRGPVVRRLIALTVPFALVPALVYVASYAQFWIEHGLAVRGFLALQRRMLDHGLGHFQLQPENSAPLSWPLLLHPIVYFRQSADPAGSAREILAVGNPALWWGFLALVPLGVLRALRRRMDWQDALVWGGYIAMFGPWLLVGRTQFIYYMLPAVPFMCLIVVAELRALGPRLGARAARIVTVLVTLVAAAGLPIWLGLAAPPGWLDRLRLLPSWR